MKYSFPHFKLKNGVNWQYRILIINLQTNEGFNDILLHIDLSMSIVKIVWNYDTQPYVPYTVHKHRL